jgi:hypothetical protein
MSTTERTHHPCPGGCGTQIPRHQLACKPDWFRLPRPLRDDVTDAYRNRPRDGVLPHLRAVGKARDWYRANPAEATQ